MAIPQTWDEAAGVILDAAAASGVTVDRTFVAPGPRFAHDASLLAVHLSANGDVGEPAGASPLGPAWDAPAVPTCTFIVTYVECCVPTPSGKAPNRLAPPAGAIDAFSRAFLANCQAVYDAVANTVDRSCYDVGTGSPRGPSGGQAVYAFPVRVSFLA